ncbi:hypothetical protein DFH28DRAFT_64196 [Melampsora americana]|nr:hypothetical protein DFH28DRAFT_64196 [Melampsora americana]
MHPINSRNTSTRRSLPFPSNNQSTTIIKPNSTNSSSLSRSINSSLSKSTSTPLPTQQQQQQQQQQQKLNQSRRQSVIPQSNRPISIATTSLSSNQNHNNNNTSNNRTPTLPRSPPLKRSPLNRNTLANFTPLSSERSRTFTTPATTPSPQVINRNLLPESTSKPEDLETEVPDDDEGLDEEVEWMMPSQEL